jgi:uncharacterized protein YkwD
MVRHHVFSHAAGDGTPVAREARTGYVRPRRAYVLDENLGWGDGSQSSAAAMMRGWQDPGHLANILDRRVHDVGIGVALGVPAIGDRVRGATYTTDFGRRG